MGKRLFSIISRFVMCYYDFDGEKKKLSRVISILVLMKSIIAKISVFNQANTAQNKCV